MDLLATVIIDLTALCILVLLFFCGGQSKAQDHGQRLFRGMLLCIAAYLLIDIAAWAVDGKALYGGGAVQMMLNTLLYAAQIVYSLLGLLYTDHWLYRDASRTRRRLWLYTLPLIAQLGLLLVNLFTGWIYTINAEHSYERGALFAPYMLVFYITTIWTVCKIIKAFFGNADQAMRKNCLWMLAFLTLPVLASLSLLFVYGVPLTGPAYALSLLMIYLTVHRRYLAEERAKTARQQQELEHMNIAVMLSQIQPHFLFNALAAIQELCHDKAPEAEAATLAFAEYLRGNIDSLRANTPIPFLQELKHTQNYVALEKRRFGDRLHVQYNIHNQTFRLPALTLQPLVENAIRCGIMRKEEGGTVVITVDRDTSSNIITIQDDGVGFDPRTPYKNDGHAHIGIENVRKRLHDMCGGDLMVQSTPGKGTVVTFWVPRTENISIPTQNDARLQEGENA